ncbi:MAG: phosphoribosylglycinamide formyltransferase [Deferribacteraceae bacterium]|jgi:phosphoribosylglycinamide formyltransferase-1|nr:phosphoribosylglycinamide formyltransferase [Deferribacteraceae bacterium]
MMNIAILLSGRGSNFLAIKEAIDNGAISNAQIVCVISNKEQAAGLESARNFGMNAIFLNPADYKYIENGVSYFDRNAYDSALLDLLKANNVDLVCLAGYMRVVTEAVINEYAGRIINIHPSLLPSFPGIDAQKQALNYGAKVSGCTVHFVDKGVDTGPIIMQTTVPVFQDDNEHELSKRILAEEHKLYIKAIALYTKGLLKIEGRKVSVVS